MIKLISTKLVYYQLLKKINNSCNKKMEYGKYVI